MGGGDLRRPGAGDAVRLELAGSRRAGVIANLLELYSHDLSDVFALDIGSDGRYGYTRLPQYWSDTKNRFPFLIMRGGRIAGFVLAARIASGNTDDVFDVAEFFVLRRYRRTQVGRRAAHALWNRLRGRWTVRVAAVNEPAVAFWRTAVRTYTKGIFTETTRLERRRIWRVFTFATPRRRAPRAASRGRTAPG